MALSLPELQESVKKKIGQGKLKNAFPELMAYVSSSAKSLEGELLNLQTRFKTLQRKSRMNLIREDEKGIQMAVITDDVFQFLGTLEDESSAPAIPADNGSTSSPAAANKTILFLSANPADTGPLQLAKEHREIKRGLEGSLAGREFDIETETAARSSDMRDSIRRKKPGIVHFSGHGLSKDDVGADAGTRGLSWAHNARPEITDFGVSGLGIALLDRNGNTHLVKNDSLSAMFELAKEDVQCVVFNNCYSQGQAEAVKEHIPYVIGMTRAVPDETAIAFAVEFYKALGDGETIPEAFKHAQVAIKMDDFPGADIPKLFE